MSSPRSYQPTLHTCSVCSVCQLTTILNLCLSLHYPLLWLIPVWCFNALTPNHNLKQIKINFQTLNLATSCSLVKIFSTLKSFQSVFQITCFTLSDHSRLIICQRYLHILQIPPFTEIICNIYQSETHFIRIRDETGQIAILTDILLLKKLK